MKFRRMMGLVPAYLSLGAIGLCAAIGVACAGVPADVEVKTPVGSVTVKGGQATFSGSLPPGKCLKVDFVNATGGSTGSATFALPGQCSVPEGTADAKFSIVDCPPSRGVVPGPLGRISPSQEVVEVFGFPIVFDANDGGRYSNAIYHFRVNVTGGSDAFQLIEPILLGGPGTPVPGNVEIVSFTQFLPNASGGMQVRAADTAPFRMFQLEWNKEPGYADLATQTNVVVSNPGNGWEVVEATVDAADIHGFGFVNRGETIRMTVEDAQAIKEYGAAVFN